MSTYVLQHKVIIAFLLYKIIAFLRYKFPFYSTALLSASECHSHWGRFIYIHRSTMNEICIHAFLVLNFAYRVVFAEVESTIFWKYAGAQLVPLCCLLNFSHALVTSAQGISSVWRNLVKWFLCCSASIGAHNAKITMSIKNLVSTLNSTCCAPLPHYLERLLHFAWTCSFLFPGVL